MAKKYKVWSREGKNEGWVSLDENGIVSYGDYNNGKIFLQREMRDYVKMVEGKKINADVRPYRYRRKNDYG